MRFGRLGVVNAFSIYGVQLVMDLTGRQPHCKSRASVQSTYRGKKRKYKTSSKSIGCVV
jgi:hypothetical protein